MTSPVGSNSSLAASSKSSDWKGQPPKNVEIPKIPVALINRVLSINNLDSPKPTSQNSPHSRSDSPLFYPLHWRNSPTPSNNSPYKAPSPTQLNSENSTNSSTASSTSSSPVPTLTPPLGTRRNWSSLQLSGGNTVASPSTPTSGSSKTGLPPLHLAPVVNISSASGVTVSTNSATGGATTLPPLAIPKGPTLVTAAAQSIVNTVKGSILKTAKNHPYQPPNF